MLVAGHFDTECPPPEGTDAKVLGVIQHHRVTRPRLDIWLGGTHPPPRAWCKSVEEYVRKELADMQVFAYKPFGAAAVAASRAASQVGYGVS
jgi:hypothetical protein